jgi:hypothetical protein
MQMVPQGQPSPRLLNTVVPDSHAPSAPAAASTRRFTRLKEALVPAIGIAIFVGVTVGCFVMAGARWFHAREIRAEQAHRGTAAAGSPAIAPTNHAAVGIPGSEQISRDDIRVTAIVLGQPRLAVINGQQAGEGDVVNVRRSARDQVKLRVTKISDGGVELTDGTQTIAAPLAQPSQPRK